MNNKNIFPRQKIGPTTPKTVHRPAKVSWSMDTFSTSLVAPSVLKGYYPYPKPQPWLFCLLNCIVVIVDTQQPHYTSHQSVYLLFKDTCGVFFLVPHQHCLQGILWLTENLQEYEQNWHKCWQCSVSLLSQGSSYEIFAKLSSIPNSS